MFYVFTAVGTGCGDGKFFGKSIYSRSIAGYNFASAQGGIAQLGERLHGMQEVSGSIPLTSTKTPREV
jgi:hypothetical protein